MLANALKFPFKHYDGLPPTPLQGKTKIQKFLVTKLWNVHSALEGYNNWTKNHQNMFGKTKIQNILVTKLWNVHSGLKVDRKSPEYIH